MPLNKGYLTANRTASGDEMYTPHYAVDPLLEFLTDKSKIIWCPFDKEWSAFNQVLTGGGVKVICSHIDEGEDFFEYEPKQWDIMISNPHSVRRTRFLKERLVLTSPLHFYFLRTVFRAKQDLKYFRTKFKCFALILA